MDRYKIASAKCGVGDGGMACGPVFGPVVAEIEVETETGDRFFLSMAEVDGYPEIYRTEESIYEMLLDPDKILDFDSIDKHRILAGEYEDILCEKDNEMHSLFRYLVFLVRSEEQDCHDFIKATIGKHTDEFVIPVSDVEEEGL